MKPRIYIAGPYTVGDVGVNVRKAIEVADRLRFLGGVPHVPHLNHLWHLAFPHDYEYWMALDMDWLAVCDWIVRIPGESPGADREEVFAKARGIPVLTEEKAVELLKSPSLVLTKRG